MRPATLGIPENRDPGLILGTQDPGPGTWDPLPGTEDRGPYIWEPGPNTFTWNAGPYLTTLILIQLSLNVQFSIAA